MQVTAESKTVYTVELNEDERDKLLSLLHGMKLGVGDLEKLRTELARQLSNTAERE